MTLYGNPYIDYTTIIETISLDTQFHHISRVLDSINQESTVLTRLCGRQQPPYVTHEVLLQYYALSSTKAIRSRRPGDLQEQDRARITRLNPTPHRGAALATTRASSVRVSVSVREVRCAQNVVGLATSRGLWILHHRLTGCRCLPDRAARLGGVNQWRGLYSVTRPENR